MCLCIPSCVLSVDGENQTARVDTLGVVKEVSTHLIDGPVETGEFLLIHVGFAISRINASEAAASLETYKQLLDEMDQEQVQVLLS